MKHFSTTLAALLMVSACASRHSEWENLNYSSVYRKAGQMENDPNYTQPAGVASCLDDDMHSCR